MRRANDGRWEGEGVTGRPRKRWIITRWAFFRDLRWIVGKGWTARYQIEDTKA